jgi:hypothetical protein
VSELLAFVAVVVAVAAPLCGHQTQPWPLRGACAWLYARLSALQPSQARREGPPPQRPPHARTARRTPAWAHTQPTDKEPA